MDNRAMLVLRGLLGGCCFVWALCACAGKQPAAAPVEPSGGGASAAREPLQGSEATLKPVLRADGHPAAADALRPLDATGNAEGKSPLVLRLPVEASFVAAPLPPGDLERYAGWRLLRSIRVGQSHLFHAELIDADRLILAMSEAEGSARVYERHSGKLVKNHVFPGLAPFQDGRVLGWPASAPADTATAGEAPAFLVGKSDGLWLYAAKTGELLRELDREPVHAMRWSSDERVLITGRSDIQTQTSVLRFFERGAGPTLKLLATLPFDERVDGWDLSRDHRLLALTHYPSNNVRVVDLHTGQDVLRFPGPNFAGDVSISPDGRMLAVGGDGLLLIDLLNPKRRAFYGYYYNNVDWVRFSPSGDALLTSSFDGRLRIFRYDTRGPALTLLKTLNHGGRANVYSFDFDGTGNALVSASGDQSLREFGATRTAPASGAAGPSAEPARFRSLSEWRTIDPAAARDPNPWPASLSQDGRYRPPLNLAPRPSRIGPGRYACKISEMYKLRECRVTKSEAGHTLLEFESANLLPLRGVLYDDGPVVRFEGFLTESESVIDCPGCEKQPLHAVFRGNGKSWRGLLLVRKYYDAYVPPELPSASVLIEEANDRFPLVLEWRGEER